VVVPFGAGADGAIAEPEVAAVDALLLCPKIADAILPKMLMLRLLNLGGLQTVPSRPFLSMILYAHAGKTGILASL
jgi:hypothetical protein